jgi:hypothetical protein
MLPLLYSGSQPDDDTMGSKHVAELYHEVVFDGYLFIPYFILSYLLLRQQGN